MNPGCPQRLNTIQYLSPMHWKLSLHLALGLGLRETSLQKHLSSPGCALHFKSPRPYFSLDCNEPFRSQLSLSNYSVFTGGETGPWRRSNKPACRTPLPDSLALPTPAYLPVMYSRSRKCLQGKFNLQLRLLQPFKNKTFNIFPSCSGVQSH